jgi:hypothetical protein
MLRALIRGSDRKEPHSGCDRACETELAEKEIVGKRDVSSLRGNREREYGYRYRRKSTSLSARGNLACRKDFLDRYENLTKRAEGGKRRTISSKVFGQRREVVLTVAIGVLVLVGGLTSCIGSNLMPFV